jgi:hypothetical protein
MAEKKNDRLERLMAMGKRLDGTGGGDVHIHLNLGDAIRQRVEKKRKPKALKAEPAAPAKAEHDYRSAAPRPWTG